MAGEKHLIEERVKAGESSREVNGKMESFFSPLLLLPFFSLSPQPSLSTKPSLSLSLSFANPIQVRFPIPKFLVFSSFFFVPSIYVFFAHCSNLFNFKFSFKNFAFFSSYTLNFGPNNNWYCFCFSDCFHNYVIVVVCFINLSFL